MLPLIGALGAILLLIGATAWFARRMLGVAPLQNPAFDLAVIQRIAVGPRQGIALVRSGSRVIAVSVGDGGVRHLFDLDVDPDAITATATRPPVGRAFSDALRRVVRRGAIVALLAILPVMAPKIGRASCRERV